MLLLNTSGSRYYIHDPSNLINFNYVQISCTGIVWGRQRGHRKGEFGLGARKNKLILRFWKYFLKREKVVAFWLLFSHSQTPGKWFHHNGKAWDGFFFRGEGFLLTDNGRERKATFISWFYLFTWTVQLPGLEGVWMVWKYHF